MGTMRDPRLRESKRIETETIDDPGKGYPYGHRYNSKARLASFWHQADEVLRFQPASVLEVGPGPGYVSEWLRREGVCVFTADIDQRVAPDVVATVRRLPFADRSFDATLCCEVLEHLPFAQLPNALRELTRVSRKGLVLSVPDKDRYLRVSIRTAGRSWTKTVEFPRRESDRPALVCQEHKWEIGRDHVGLKDVLTILRDVTGGTIRTFRVPENPHHRMFVIALTARK